MRTLFVTLAICMLPLTLKSQTTETVPSADPQSSFRVSLVDFFMNTFYIEYERMFENRTSFSLNGEIILGEEYDSEYLGQGIGAQYRIYSNTLAVGDYYKNEGLYLGPYVHYRNIALTDLDTDNDLTFTAFKAGVLAGIQFTVLNKVSIDLNMGGGIQIADGSDDEQEYYYIFDIYEPDFTGIKPMGNITVGLKF